MGVAGTLASTRDALKGKNTWNLSGGYHHASPRNSQGFCIYNDIGIAVQQMRVSGLLNPSDKILIVDIDAHHGNDNAYTFMEDTNVTLLDIYNNDIYPQNNLTKERVDINAPLQAGTTGIEYNKVLNKLASGYQLAFVIAGTDVLLTDPLGRLGLSVAECAERDKLVFQKLQSLNIPAIFLGGGGYSKDSAKAIIESIKSLHSNF